tara:strand:+ start:835 stop:1752 length:918 start_codon:yes stop_codon:yes gene_type:complete
MSWPAQVRARKLKSTIYRSTRNIDFVFSVFSMSSFPLLQEYIYYEDAYVAVNSTPTVPDVLPTLFEYTDSRSSKQIVPVSDTVKYIACAMKRIGDVYTPCMMIAVAHDPYNHVVFQAYIHRIHLHDCPSDIALRLHRSIWQYFSANFAPLKFALLKPPDPQFVTPMRDKLNDLQFEKATRDKMAEIDKTAAEKWWTHSGVRMVTQQSIQQQLKSFNDLVRECNILHLDVDRPFSSLFTDSKNEAENEIEESIKKNSSWKTASREERKVILLDIDAACEKWIDERKAQLKEYVESVRASIRDCSGL